jgi:SAM-dependent methyltransferase
VSYLNFWTLFGSAGVWVAGAVLVAFGILVAAAFVQNREIAVWRVKIGVRTQQTVPSAADRTPRSRRQGSAAGDDSRSYDEIFDADRAAAFYERIAPVYDRRNSEDLGATHLATIVRLQDRLALIGPLRVLDLGGGTGNPIATHFFDNQAIEWTYVDACRVLARTFRQSLEAHPLGQRMIIETGDLNVAVRRLPRSSYDVILLSLVLTSMPALPDFADIARLLAPQGTLIVSDIGPSYTRLKPYYKVNVSGKLIALRTVAVDPLDISRKAVTAGLVMTELTALGDDEPYYSFIATFARP